MKTLLIRCFASILVIVVCTSLSGADIRYVAQSGQTPVAGYLDWESAADNIQDAIDAAKSGDTIIVSNGVYDTGTVLINEHLNRVNMNKNDLILMAFSTNPVDTVIMGGGSLESNPIRCVYVSGNRCTIAGFTLTNGHAVTTSSSTMGGGGLLRINTATGIFMMSNCWVTGCSSATTGGGVHLQNYSGTFTHCKFSNNYSQYRGGGIFANVGASLRPGMILHSEIIDNYAEDYGGGTYSIDIYDSLIANNISESSGGGSYNCSAERCTFYNNDARGGSGGGAVFCRSTDILSECTIVSNKTAKHGGATYYGIMKDSVVAWNSAESYAGGCYYPTLVEDTLLHNNSAGTIGGAIFGTLDSVVTGCTIVSNTAGGNGGGVHRITPLENCFLAYNTSGNDGGGAADSYAYNTTFMYNKAVRYGGGMSATVNHTTAFASNCLFVGNEAERGGGQYGWSLDRERRSIDCIFSNNLAIERGGGGYLIEAEGCLFIENRALSDNLDYGRGGGLYAGSAINSRFIRNSSSSHGGGANSPSLLVNCLFYGNHADRYSGAVHGPSALLNCTVVSNTVALSNYGGAFAEPVTATNCIVWGNLQLQNGAVNNWYTSKTSARYNHCCISPLPTGDQDEGGNINVDPLLVDIDNLDFNLKRGSPCVNAGINATWGIDDLDLAGKRRVFPPNGKVDMGALERIPEILGTIINVR